MIGRLHVFRRCSGCFPLTTIYNDTAQRPQYPRRQQGSSLVAGNVITFHALAILRFFLPTLAMPSIWSTPAVFFASWRTFALKNTILCTISYLPVAFLVYCALRHKKTWEAYKNSVFFLAAIQSLGVLPTCGYVLYHLFFVSHENQETTYFWCTMSRGVFGTAAYAVFQAPTAVAICRYFSIVHFKMYRMRTVSILSIAAMSTTFAYWIYVLGWGIPIRATSCSALGTIPRTLTEIYHYTLVLFTFSSLPLNLLLIRKLRHNRADKGSTKSNGRRVDELSVTYGLVVQGCVPCFVIAASITYNVLLSQGFVFSSWFSIIMDSTGYIVLGINTLFSFVFIRTFRKHFVALFVPPSIVSRFSLVSNASSQADRFIAIRNAENDDNLDYLVLSKLVARCEDYD